MYACVCISVKLAALCQFRPAHVVKYLSRGYQLKFSDVAQNVRTAGQFKPRCRMIV